MGIFLSDNWELKIYCQLKNWILCLKIIVEFLFLFFRILIKLILFTFSTLTSKQQKWTKFTMKNPTIDTLIQTLINVRLFCVKGIRNIGSAPPGFVCPIGDGISISDPSFEINKIRARNQTL